MTASGALRKATASGRQQQLSAQRLLQLLPSPVSASSACLVPRSKQPESLCCSPSLSLPAAVPTSARRQAAWWALCSSLSKAISC